MEISLIPVNSSMLLPFSVDDDFWPSESEEGHCKLSSCLCCAANCSVSGTLADDGLAMAVVGPCGSGNVGTHARRSDLRSTEKDECPAKDNVRREW